MAATTTIPIGMSTQMMTTNRSYAMATSSLKRSPLLHALAAMALLISVPSHSAGCEKEGDLEEIPHCYLRAGDSFLDAGDARNASSQYLTGIRWVNTGIPPVLQKLMVEAAFAGSRDDLLRAARLRGEVLRALLAE
ncbi:MAG: hypothetical protein AAF290_16010 [Pseudomonadota bacterium]